MNLYIHKHTHNSQANTCIKRDTNIQIPSTLDRQCAFLPQRYVTTTPSTPYRVSKSSFQEIRVLITIWKQTQEANDTLVAPAIPHSPHRPCIGPFPAIIVCVGDFFFPNHHTELTMFNVYTMTVKSLDTPSHVQRRLIENWNWCRGENTEEIVGSASPWINWV